MRLIQSLILFLLFGSSLYSQIAEYGKNLKKGKYQTYLAKDKTAVKIGDTLHINPPGGSQYVYISQSGMPAGTILANKDIIVSQIRVWKENLLVGFKGYGMAIVYIDYENALEMGEITNPKRDMTRENAIQLLKEQKELLDLEIISQEEYDKIKLELLPFINK